VTAFRDSDELYSILGRFFEEVTLDDELGPKFRQADTIVRYELSDPDASITVRLRQGEDSQVDFGPTEMEPEVVMTMDADTAHRFWQGAVNVTVALARGQIKAKGPVTKILKLVPIAKPAFPRYVEELRELGREDLIEV
jgi:putative sterol carrier protein